MGMAGIRAMLWGSYARRGVSISLAAHVGAVGVFVASQLSWPSRMEEEKEERRDPPMVTFSIQAPKTDATNVDETPKLAEPTAVKDRQGPVSDKPVAEVAFLEGGTGQEAMLWTPLPPTPRGMGGDAGGAPPAAAAAMPRIDMPEEGREPKLVSFGEGRFDEAAALGEATRLSGAGRMEFEVRVGVDGIPIAASVAVSSGSNTLDSLGSGVVMAYRYEPGTDAEGRPVESTTIEILEWSRNGVQRGDTNADGTPASPVAGAPGTMDR